MAAASSRLPLVDALRGLAVAAMVVYHAGWDINYFRLLDTDFFAGPVWRTFAEGIAASFLLVVGVSLVLSEGRGFRPRHFARRLAVIGGCAGAITFATWIAVPEGMIFFGILHNIAVSSVLGLAFLRLPAILVAAAGAGCLLAPAYLADPAFNAAWLQWLGLMTHGPNAYDYVPVLPWFGWVLFGMALVRTVPRAWLAWAPPGERPLVWMGRHSLIIYMAHQPLLFGLAYALARISASSP